MIVLQLLVLNVVSLVPSLAALQEKTETPKPVKQHEVLKKFEGTWAIEGKLLDDQGKPSGTIKLTETGKMVCGGLWLLLTDTGEAEGKPYEAYSLIGYDASKGKYVASGVDSNSTDLEIAEATYDEQAAVLTMISTGHYDDGSSYRRKYVVQVKSPDEIHTTSYEGAEGKERIVAETIGRRKKP
jgi:hypothetical protein